jgi:DNA-binding NtrC family response regulator
MEVQTKSAPGTVVIVDDDADVLRAARLALASVFPSIRALRVPTELEGALHSGPVDAILMDMNFLPGRQSGEEGLQWLQQLQSFDRDMSVVLMTAYGDVPVAVEALKRGATDFVLKPWQNEKLVATMSAAVALARARRESARLRARNDTLVAETSIRTDALIGSAPALQRVFDVIRRTAPTDANVLLLGESGTGKELTAREIHRLSKRHDQPFVSVDLGAITESLFESELFGHRRGAFTGAERDRAGRVQAAHGGTLFLDEIGNLPIHLQGKLLTMIERREVVPLGATQPIPVDIRLVTATNRSLAELQQKGLFRSDLLYRVKTVEITLPPLRERREDIPVLLEHFLAHYARRTDVARRRLAPQTLELLERYAWPGNIRELRQAVERATILASDTVLGPHDFPMALHAIPESAAEQFDLNEIERQTIQRALARFEGNVSLAAAALGLTRPALYRRFAKHGL